MNLPSNRVFSLFAFIICCGLIATSFYLEIYIKLEPCPLCVIQRFLIMILGLLFLLPLFFNFTQKKERYYYFFVLLISAFGAAVAGRQVWLTTLPPDQVPSCGASLRYLLEVLPVNRVVQLVFQGTGECAKVTWRLWSLSLPEWSLIFFIALAFIALFQTVRPVSKTSDYS